MSKWSSAVTPDIQPKRQKEHLPKCATQPACDTDRVLPQDSWTGRIIVRMAMLSNAGVSSLSSAFLLLLLHVSVDFGSSRPAILPNENLCVSGGKSTIQCIACMLLRSLQTCWPFFFNKYNIYYMQQCIIGAATQIATCAPILIIFLCDCIAIKQ